MSDLSCQCNERCICPFFRKRQNVYYVKLQEDISTLSGDEDYVLTITSIYGPEKVMLFRLIDMENALDKECYRCFRKVSRPSSTTRITLRKSCPRVLLTSRDHTLRLPTPAASMKGASTQLFSRHSGKNKV